MGKIEFADCQDIRNQKKIMEIECPNCHDPEGLEVFVKDGITKGDSKCCSCGYVLPDGTDLDELEE